MWISELPTTPGRYFYRDGDKYGICLVAWTRPYVIHRDVYNSELKAVTGAIFTRECGDAVNFEPPGWW